MWHFTSGLPETRCGAGSTLSNTIGLRQWLPQLFEKYDIKTVIDAPCGDFNWMSRTDLSRVEYRGLDVDPKNIRTARGRESIPASFEPLTREFLNLDVLEEHIGKADLIICRDFFQHLPWHEVSWLLSAFKKAAPYLLATSHNNLVNDNLLVSGGFRPLNLMVNPFCLPEPIDSIDDCGRILGLWRWE